MSQVLIVHDNEDLRGLLAQVFAQELGPTHSCVASSAYDAQAQRAAADPATRFAILGAAAPSRPGESADALTHRAVKAFLPGLDRPGLTVLVLATETDTEICGLLGRLAAGHQAIVSPGSGWMQMLRRTALQAFGLSARHLPDTRRTRSVLRIVVSNGSQGRWTLERRGPIEGDLNGVLDLDLGYVDELCTLSDRLPSDLRDRDDLWDEYVGPLANGMHRVLFDRPKNAELKLAFDAALEEPGGAENLRMVFDLSSDTFRLPVETLKPYVSASSAKQWYALRSAILRHYDGEGPLQPLFWDQESRTTPLNFLLIAADPRDGGGLRELEYVEHEVDDVERSLLAQCAQGVNIGRVKVLKLSEHPGESARTLLDGAMRDGPWHVVHFAGHALIGITPQSSRPRGRLMLSPATEEAIDFHAFARAIPDAQLLFVSSCQSADQAFLQDAIRQSIPAVIGYRWPVADLQARHMACHFYDALLDPGGPAFRSLGRALAQARKQVFPHVTWASPMLLAKGTRGDESMALQRRDNGTTRSGHAP